MTFSFRSSTPPGDRSGPCTHIPDVRLFRRNIRGRSCGPRTPNREKPAFTTTLLTVGLGEGFGPFLPVAIAGRLSDVVGAVRNVRRVGRGQIRLEVFPATDIGAVHHLTTFHRTYPTVPPTATLTVTQNSHGDIEGSGSGSICQVARPCAKGTGMGDLPLTCGAFSNIGTVRK